MVMSSGGLGPENDCSDGRPAAIVKDRPLLSSVRMLHKVYDRKCSVEKKIAGCESEGAW
jgi:hypothetical protein